MRGGAPADGSSESERKKRMRRVAAVAVSTALLVVSVVFFAVSSGRLGGEEGEMGFEELLQSGERKAIVAELERRQKSIAVIQRSLQEEEESSRSVLMRLLSLDGGNRTSGGGENSPNVTMSEGSEGVQMFDLVDNATNSSTGAEGGMDTATGDVSPNASTPYASKQTAVVQQGEANATEAAAVDNATSSSNTSSASLGLPEKPMVDDQYAEAKRMFAPSNDTEEIDVALKEQPITEYSNETIKLPIPFPPPSHAAAVFGSPHLHEHSDTATPQI